MDSKTLAIALARALDARKAQDIRVLKVEDLTTVTDYFVIATGTSTTHVGALADEAEFVLSRQDVRPLRTEGHMAMVFFAEVPLVLASRTILRISRPSVVGIRLCSSTLSCVRALI